MKCTISTTKAQDVVDITDQISALVTSSGVKEGLCQVFVPHATAAITINENADPNIGVDLINALEKAFPTRNNYLHDRIDGNAHAHVKAAVVGPSETIPIKNGALMLGTWQDLFLCDFDGPRKRTVHVMVIASSSIPYQH